MNDAHVGRWNREDNSDDFDAIQILDPEYLHPQYDDEDFPYDFLLLKLSRQSSKPYVKLNVDAGLPTGERVNEVTALGFGYTRPGDAESEARILQEADLTYIPNDICEQSKDPGLGEGYQNLITDDMLCAADNGQDSCQGDSGGPLIMDGGNPGQDVLVGIVSWYVCSNCRNFDLFCVHASLNICCWFEGVMVVQTLRFQEFMVESVINFNGSNLPFVKYQTTPLRNSNVRQLQQTTAITMATTIAMLTPCLSLLLFSSMIFPERFRGMYKTEIMEIGWYKSLPELILAADLECKKQSFYLRMLLTSSRSRTHLVTAYVVTFQETIWLF